MKSVRWLALGCLALVLLPACAPRDLRATANPVTLQIRSATVQGVLTLPVTPEPVPAVVLLAGYGSGDMDETVGKVKPLRDIAAGLGRRGIATLRFDKPTLRHRPPATFTPTEEYVDAAAAALAFLRTQPTVDATRLYLLGHSFGGTMAPRAAIGQNVAGIILVSAPARPIAEILASQFTYLRSLGGTIGHNAALATPDAQEFLRTVDSPDLRPDTVLRSELAYGYRGAYFLDLRQYDPVRTATSLHLPMLVVQGRRDYLVPVDRDLKLWKAGLAGAPHVRVRVYPDANHALVNGIGQPTPDEYQQPGHVASRVIADIANWIEAR